MYIVFKKKYVCKATLITSSIITNQLNRLFNLLDINNNKNKTIINIINLCYSLK